MKQKKAKFKTVKQLARYIEAGGAVVHTKTGEAFGSLRELPVWIESELPQLRPYIEHDEGTEPELD